MESVYESYVEGREWYFAVQWASAAVCGVVLGALQVIGNDDASLACPTAYAGCGVAIAFGAADMTLLHVLRPTAVRLEMWSGAIICALNIVSQALAASNAIDASNTLVTVCALLQLVVMLLLMLNGVAFVAQGEEPLRAAEGEHMGARCKAQKLEFVHNDTTKTHRSAKSTLIVVKAHDGKSVEGVPIVDLQPIYCRGCAASLENSCETGVAACR
ncbi:membrane-associated protein, putative [Bodo saltans]|uniref:Membrane-associated protein, putative n=1 Tax=Bodo saltans TaxID=75058 RepID=A0A0S4JHZ4_BODSA|nr:membrane-associated protein, putative [Bodo saltans]|eukprot:CUG91083.1 membrane-associated protein, putative [Bodo saltans]